MNQFSTKRLKAGKFVVFDGPNGVGKSTLIDSVAISLRAAGSSPCLTKEPTVSELGVFIRQRQDTMAKETLACLVAANRYEHLTSTIEPAIARGDVVLSDRYFPSSLVYQRMDGVDIAFIESLNQKIRVPDLTVFLNASKETLKYRLAQRERRTRFEHTQDLEIKMYLDAADLLFQKKWKVMKLDVDNLSVSEAAKLILDQITGLQ